MSRRSGRPHVVMIVQNNPYRRDHRVQREAHTLMDSGYRVSVIAPRDQGEARRSTFDGVEVWGFPPAPAPTDGVIGHLVEYAWSAAWIEALLLAVATRGRIDVVHVNNPPDFLVMLATPLRLGGASIVLDVHELSPELLEARFGPGRHTSVRRLLTRIEAMACRSSDAVIVTNESYRTAILARTQVPAARLTVVRNGPDDTLVVDAEPLDALRSRSPAIVGYVGEMNPQDGVHLLVDAIAHLVRDQGRTELLCVLVGAGDSVEGLLRQAESLGVGDHVEHVGYVHDRQLLTRLLASFDVCVEPAPSNPYNDRSTMMKITEYLAAARPVVCFDLPEHRVTAADAAWYARADDTTELARGIAELLDDPRRRREMGARGRLRVESELAWRHQAPHLLEAYAPLVARDRPVPGTATGGVTAAWDRFVTASPGGTVLQTSHWGEVKQAVGMIPERVVVVGGPDEVRGGSQMLIATVARLGRVGYVPYGPLVPSGDLGAAEEVLDGLDRIARRHHLVTVLVQPPPGGDELVELLARRGYRCSALEIAPSASVRVDLQRDAEETLASMRTSVRRNVRRTLRAGVEFRLGTDDDLQTFAALHAATAARQGFVPVSAEYLRWMWDALHPHGLAEIGFVELDGEPLCGGLLTCAGGTVTHRLAGWGGHRQLRPNETFHHLAMCWARDQGYACYDLGGISRAVAVRLVSGGASDEQIPGTDEFKLGFGGEPVLFPPTLERLRVPGLRRAYAAAQHRLVTVPFAAKTMRRLQTG